VLLVATRVGLWLGVQLGLAGLLLVVGEAATGGEALDAAAGWWMVYGALVDLGTLGVIFWLLRRDHRAYRSLLGPPAEPVAYLGVVLPRLEERLGRPWLAAAIAVAVWAGEHALYPLLPGGGGGLDLGFAAYRVASVLPYLAIWTAAYYALGRRRLLPVMAARWGLNAGTAAALALGLVQ
jgi:Type II CAAX prenyl endopeptidase Rce1-like